MRERRCASWRSRVGPYDKRSLYGAEDEEGERAERPAARRRSPRPGCRRPALLSSARPAPSSTTPSAGRRPRSGRRVARCGAEPDARQRADQDRGRQQQVDVAARTGGRSPATHSRIAAWKTSVPTTRRGISRKPRISADRDQRAASRREVRPSTKPTDRAERRPRRPCGASSSSTVVALAGAVGASARASSTSAPVSSSAAAISGSRTSSSPSRSSSTTPSDRARARAERQPPREVRLHRALAQVQEAAGGLRDRARRRGRSRPRPPA